MSLDWLKDRDEGPFCLMYHHKAPHRPWEPDEKHASMYEGEDIPEPETLFDDYFNRSRAASEARMRVATDFVEEDLKGLAPSHFSRDDVTRWNYQRYIKDYLRVVASIDDNVGRVLDYLDENGLAENTLICYTSDQGFFLGDHGWYDKRFMYEESLRMPFIVRYPRGIRAGSVNSDIALNVDFAQTFLDLARISAPPEMQGNSLRPLFEGTTPEDWRASMYYRYWMHLAHHRVCAHYGVRTLRHKLIYYYGEALGAQGAIEESWDPEWELFDLDKDPCELNNVYGDPAYADVVRELTAEMERLQSEVGDQPAPSFSK
jgi:arylsulfatase A-like enzyme